MTLIADRIIAFNKQLRFTGSLPEGIRIMNPFLEDEWAWATSTAFYKKYYADNHPRRIILGINPGRFGAGLTGVPFTDPKRLQEKCAIEYPGKQTHEPSSVFIYEMIDAFGGPDAFYSQFFINSISPLGFTSVKNNGKEVNYNYYDSKALYAAVLPFIEKSLRAQLDIGVQRETCFCLGTGKNLKFLQELNSKHGYYKKIIGLEHPRFIMQYRSKQKDQYINKYLEAFRGNT
jgi:hypothetical protein